MDPWDCIVVGTGAAGLSAALVLGRARRRTLVLDAGAPSNAVAHGIGGLLGHDGRPPAALYADGRAELRAYPSVVVRDVAAVDGARDDGGFVLELADGTREAARAVLLATGADYRGPDLPGVAERWGRTVFHCPFCHGWEVRGRALGVLDGGPSGVHRAQLLRAWSDDVVLLTGGPADLDGEARVQLAAAGVPLDERPVAGLRGPGDALEAVVFADGSERPVGGLLVASSLHRRSPLAERLGAGTAEPGPLGAEAVAVDAMGRTRVPGLYAAGDVETAMPTIAGAIAAGSRAAAVAVGEAMAAAVATAAA